jgi:glycine/D-amino acid oxidase-like deaminating enzyme
VTSRVSQDLIVVGAGIIGASIAWHATRAGLKTMVIDASGPLAGASGASDGAVSVATKKSGLMAALAGESLGYTISLARPGAILDAAFAQRPSYLFATSPHELGALDRLKGMLSQQDLPVSVVSDSGKSGSSVEGLGPSVLRVMELSGEGHMTGYDATLAFLRASGADMRWPCSLEGFDMDRDHVFLHTSTGRLRTARLVIANGLGAGALLPALPISPRSGQLIVTDRAAPADFPHLSGSLTSAAYLLDKTTAQRDTGLPAPVVIDPLRTGQLLIGSSREEDGTDRRTDFHTVRRILQSATDCLPALARRRIIRVFAGVRASSGDGRPVFGPLADAPNICVATAFEGDGICLAPLIGREVANVLTDRPVLPALQALSPERFAASGASLR